MIFHTYIHILVIHFSLQKAPHQITSESYQITSESFVSNNKSF